MATYLAAFQLVIPGAGNQGVPLSAQLYNQDGSTNGGAVVTGFVDLSDTDNGYYASFLSIPKDFIGAIKWTRTDSSTGIGIETITPLHDGELLRRVAGLLGENAVIQPLTFDASGNMLTGTLRLYDTLANALADDGATGLLESYPILGVTANGLLTKGTTTRTGS